MIRRRLRQIDVENGFLLDGYPRTAAQMNYLDEILEEREKQLDIVLQLTADDDELTARLLVRANESGRSDDNEVVIRRRLELYHQQTEAVIRMYSDRGILTPIDGIGEIYEVLERTLSAVRINSAAPSPFSN
jgi:adenylate kinase